jgi:hypothetical protein
VEPGKESPFVLQCPSTGKAYLKGWVIKESSLVLQSRRVSLELRGIKLLTGKYSKFPPSLELLPSMAKAYPLLLWTEAYGVEQI